MLHGIGMVQYKLFSKILSQFMVFILVQTDEISLI